MVPIACGWLHCFKRGTKRIIFLCSLVSYSAAYTESDRQINVKDIEFDLYLHKTNIKDLYTVKTGLTCYIQSKNTFIKWLVSLIRSVSLVKTIIFPT